MKIKVLGCSGAKFPGHNIPGFLLDNDIIFDAGSLTGVLGEKAQFKIKNIFITHAHLDHIRSIPFLADNIVLGNVDHKVNLYSISPVINTIKRHLLNSSLWPDFTIIPRPNDAILNLVKLRVGQPLKINHYTVIPYKVNHTVPAVGYLVEDEKGKRVFYTGDTGPARELWEKISNTIIHCLIIDVSFPNNMEDTAIKTGHLTPRLFKKELLKIHYILEHIYITHPKPQFIKTIKTELEEMRLKSVKLFRDGDTIRV